MIRNFMSLLRAQWEQGKFVCVGLDSDYDKIPAHLKVGRTIRHTIFEFNQGIILATMNVVAAYKPNIAFYEWSEEALLALEDTISFIHEIAPHIPVILDCKRADIGDTNLGYVKMVERFNADAITIQNYFGYQAMKPFLDRADMGVIVLCHTSNPGAAEFQNLQVVDQATGETFPLYQVVAEHVADPNTWNRNDNCAIVMGATFPEELGTIRKIVGQDMPILIPGIGKQGGDLEKALRFGFNSDFSGVIINNSSGIIFASDGEDFADKAGEVAEKLHGQISEIRTALIETVIHA